VPDVYILPGFIDAHVHIESSMATPGAFALAAVRHGTVAVVSDPHEIANVMGVAGVEFMLRDAEKVPLRFTFGAPSCVPATSFETSGAAIRATEIAKLLADDRIGFLSEMMNFPGVINRDPEIMARIDAAKKNGKPVDGHAPGLRGEDLKKYVAAGISTDHECTTIEEAVEKISLGMKILIREGSAARNLEMLHPLIAQYPDMVMLCCDDIHPDELLSRHIDDIVRRLIGKGYDIFDVLKASSVNPVVHYNLETGLLRPGDSADFIVVDNLTEINVQQTYIKGAPAYDNGRLLFLYQSAKVINNFKASPVKPFDIRRDVGGTTIRVIEAYDGELFTGCKLVDVSQTNSVGYDLSADIIKIVVKERYTDKPPVTGFVKGFGIKSGAFASSVAHDSHNIIAVGTSDEAICHAINTVISKEGGLAWWRAGETLSLPLNIAGIMSSEPVSETATAYKTLTDAVRETGSPLQSPFMTLSFMALLVIPDLKIGDKGLFDVNRFELVPLIVEQE
jgi:adenine deaminase